jgi:hypothetical protein
LTYPRLKARQLLDEEHCHRAALFVYFLRL